MIILTSEALPYDQMLDILRGNLVNLLDVDAPLLCYDRRRVNDQRRLVDLLLAHGFGREIRGVCLDEQSIARHAFYNFTKLVVFLERDRSGETEQVTGVDDFHRLIER